MSSSSVGRPFAQGAGTTYGNVPAEIAEAVEEERKDIERIIEETQEVASWLQQREQAARITGLYGK